jgi:hypothetical protein
MKVAIIKIRGKPKKSAMVFGEGANAFAITTRMGKVVVTSATPLKGEEWEMFAVNLSVREEMNIKNLSNLEIGKKERRVWFPWFQDKKKIQEKRISVVKDAEMITRILNKRGKIILRGYEPFEITPALLRTSPTLFALNGQ